jgi:hypothetical protein
LQSNFSSSIFQVSISSRPSCIRDLKPG